MKWLIIRLIAHWRGGINAKQKKQDISKVLDKSFTISFNGKPIPTVEGESVLSALLASNIRQLQLN
ncbi:2Fe-2S iron-sulfur cluster-binding protein [Vibrio sp. 10N.222.52.B12]|uniref:2Fe-2S iron-sulfur cluster-binding protein n=1 Tax=Vibrio sp. 10N.222.52.B12 TaxID=1880840 RepID=UPI00321FF0D5